jgi:hypothetical protein
VKVDGTKEGEKLDSMLWELGEILVDHLQCAFKTFSMIVGTWSSMRDCIEVSTVSMQRFSRYSHIEVERGCTTEYFER